MKPLRKALKKQRPVTMRDVALLAGVSQSTVSRVLSEADSAITISEETYKKVRDAVEQLGYYPNITARSLRQQKTELIAIMIADISNPFYHSIVRAVQDVARGHNYDVLIANTDHIYENERHFCQAMIRRPVDGIIMVPYHQTAESIDILIQRTGAEVVVLGQHIFHPTVDIFHSDDELATYETVEWLIRDKHHQQIGFIGVPDTKPSERRLNGYTQALENAGIPVQEAYIEMGDWTVESGKNAMVKLLALPNRPTAVFACNDHMAIGALNTVVDSGLRVPQDVAIVGFDNIPATTLVRPRLTTVAQHPIEMGQQLAEALFERIEGTYSGIRRVYRGELTLIEREST
jgi:LacI family transcriptional regulator